MLHKNQIDPSEPDLVPGTFSKIMPWEGFGLETENSCSLLFRRTCIDFVIITTKYM